MLRGIRILVNMRACGDMYICGIRRHFRPIRRRTTPRPSTEELLPCRYAPLLSGNPGLLCVREATYSGGVGGLSAREVSAMVAAFGSAAAPRGGWPAAIISTPSGPRAAGKSLRGADESREPQERARGRLLFCRSPCLRRVEVPRAGPSRPLFSGRTPMFRTVSLLG